MRVLGVAWLGVFPGPGGFGDTVSFFTDLLGLRKGPISEVAHLETARGDIVEVFRPEARYPYADGPLPGFLVEDVPSAADELRAAGTPLLGDLEAWEDHAWQHFRAPDGSVWEVTSGPFSPDAPAPGLPRIGIRTARFAEMVSFARKTLALEVADRAELEVVLAASNGDRLEVIAEDEPGHAFLATGTPVAAIEVDDVPSLRPQLVFAGVELLGGTDREGAGEHRQHLRAPDGHVYEVLSRGG
ncbi:MAG: hypothetical protein HY658_09445 [Actinobacteria bacterium]|nr:hypothetical protein [Actinomycetota bacterium]